jgi:hypothetical protein
MNASTSDFATIALALRCHPRADSFVRGLKPGRSGSVQEEACAKIVPHIDVFRAPSVGQPGERAAARGDLVRDEKQ